MYSSTKFLVGTTTTNAVQKIKYTTASAAVAAAATTHTFFRAS
jgi:hypothetical protein